MQANNDLAYPGLFKTHFLFQDLWYMAVAHAWQNDCHGALYIFVCFTESVVYRTLHFYSEEKENDPFWSAHIYFFTARLLSSMQSVIIIVTAVLSFHASVYLFNCRRRVIGLLKVLPCFLINGKLVLFKKMLHIRDTCIYYMCD